jgi:hypothetical protein
MIRLNTSYNHKTDTEKDKIGTNPQPPKQWFKPSYADK